MTIKTVVWGENIHEHLNEVVGNLYPEGMHTTIAKALNRDSDIEATTATLQEPEHGLSAERLEQTDVLIWWGHKDHGSVRDEIVERVVARVHEGMGLIVLHSGHFAKPFKRLMGTPCALKWREAGERERVWTVNPGHPIAAGIPEQFVLENEEMYGEFFSVPEPLETVFISWFSGGEIFRSGLTWRRGAGNIFYFRPGHETYPTYHNETIQQVISNAVKWAYNPRPALKSIHDAPNVPVDQALEPIQERGPKLHKAGEAGYR
ncbi:trehalose utilization protein ThuA [Agrobacterium vitis]|uniref:ThuA domain-containing protein n=1 Tax=Agrobacterium vitis TaxID=373 RepID=UPI000871F72B|nr:ThuA domain-containing protein [Agrobacterium vitis]MCE6075701.1 trehalose utilization protein ThuA [Agrobacterium vitis]MCM2452358.1 trehalose utilization protein ThuA [Agrobacterium vitis]MCM2468179.1 trehalose utilization protein ThuA [Agrobacterium vitis]MUO70357.1 trehalose utilization protein ThuA [Agrobacterium vitis]MUO82452.1 trehalose utilization protein ThuA [Agrobacterium vitis]